MAPAALLLGSPDLILAVGAAVPTSCTEYIPVVVLAATDLAELRTGDRVTISEDGAVRIG